MTALITKEEAGKMIDYIDRETGILEKQRTLLEVRISINRELRDRYRDLWLSLEREERAREK